MEKALAKEKFEYLTFEQKHMEYAKAQYYLGFTWPRQYRYFRILGSATGHVWYEVTVCASDGACQTFYVDAGWTYGGQIMGNYGGPDHIFFEPPPPPPPLPVNPPNPYGCGKPAVCFVAGTVVQTREGPRPIESVSPGDIVLTYDLLLQRMITTKVVALEVHDGDFEVLELNVHDAETLGVTTGHPFLTRRGWVWSEHLNRYGEVCTGHGEFTKVTISGGTSGNASTVYNVRTEQGTYLVGTSGLVVSGRSMYDRVAVQSRPELTSGDGSINVPARAIDADGATVT